MFFNVYRIEKSISEFFSIYRTLKKTFLCSLLSTGLKNTFLCSVASIECSSAFCIFYLLTYSMVQSLSWEANWFAASREIPRISRNPKVHYRTHKRPSLVSILGQPNPVHIPTPHLLEILPNIIHPSTPRSPQWFLPSCFPTKTLYTPFPHPYAPHAHSISFFSIL